MAISQYWVGQIPAKPLAIDVRDSEGNRTNLSTATSFRVRILDSDNNEVDTTGSVLTTTGASEGRFVFRWPTDRSLFNKPGEYVLQLEINGLGFKDYTTVHTIRVRKLGGVR